MCWAGVVLFEERPALQCGLILLSLPFLCAAQTESNALLLFRASGFACSKRARKKATGSLLLLLFLRLGLLAAAALPTAGFLLLFLCKSASFPPTVTGRLLFCAGCAALLAAGFFLRWNRLLRAAPAFLLSGATLRRSVALSARLMAAKRKELATLRRHFCGWFLLCVLVAPLGPVWLFYRQSEMLLLLNDA